LCLARNPRKRISVITRKKERKKRSSETAPCALISACALGIPCRYDGSAKSGLAPLIPAGLIPVPICPEQLGGLPTPRPPATISGGDGRDVISGRARVINQRGEDVTENFTRGAREAVRIAALVGAEKAYLVEKSPSCGVNIVWTASGLCPGMGVAAAALSESGIALFALEEE
jgi:uncharacterized protein YbbK (DUF523 family)